MPYFVHYYNMMQTKEARMLDNIAEEKRSNEELKNENTQLQAKAADLRDSLARTKVWIHMYIPVAQNCFYKYNSCSLMTMHLKTCML